MITPKAVPTPLPYQGTAGRSAAIRKDFADPLRAQERIGELEARLKHNSRHLTSYRRTTSTPLWRPKTTLWRPNHDRTLRPERRRRIHLPGTPASSPPVDRTVPVDTLEAGAEINLDFDGAGRLVGIEVLGASNHLPEAILNEAEKI